LQYKAVGGKKMGKDERIRADQATLKAERLGSQEKSRGRIKNQVREMRRIKEKEEEKNK